MTRTIFTLSALTLTIGILARSAEAVVVADIGADWVDANTLPTGWEYLEANLPPGAVGQIENPLTMGTSIGNGGNTGFGSNGTWSMSGVLGEINGVGSQFEIFGDGDSGHGGVVGTDLLVHPKSDSSGELVIARYTFDVSGDATIEGGFHGPTRGNRIGSVYLNDTAIYTSADGTPDRATTGAFNLNAIVAAGDTVSFVVDRLGDYAADETAIRATIDVDIATTEVPEPASIAIWTILGLLGLSYCGFARRRAKAKA